MVLQGQVEATEIRISGNALSGFVKKTLPGVVCTAVETPEQLRLGFSTVELHRAGVSFWVWAHCFWVFLLESAYLSLLVWSTLLL